MIAEGNNLAVGLGELRISREPGDVLVAYGLGSCVGVAMYDSHARVGGLLHAVLPERQNGAEPLSPKYADSGIDALLAGLERQGALRSRLTIWMAGGANMLTAPGFKQTLNIGDRNVASALARLGALSLRLAAQEVGGNSGRTVRLLIGAGKMTVRVIGSPEHEIGKA